MAVQNVLVSWSGGKDSALALSELLKENNYRVSALLTTVTEDYDRISMHGVRRVLLERQAASLGFPLEKVLISKNASNEEYETNMGKVLSKYKQAGVLSVVFGDIFLEDLRQYREGKLAALDLQAIFPSGRETPVSWLIRSSLWGSRPSPPASIPPFSARSSLAGRLTSAFFLSYLPRLTLVARTANSTPSFMPARFLITAYPLHLERPSCGKTVSTIVI
jgi:hypothetical protein